MIYRFQYNSELPQCFIDLFYHSIVQPYIREWNLTFQQNTGQLGHKGYDLNVTWAWKHGYTGKSIKCAVFDDGVQPDNLDLISDYVRIN